MPVAVTQQQQATSPSKQLGSGTPAVGSTPQRIVVGERSEVQLAGIAFNDSQLGQPIDLKQSGLLRRIRMLLTGTMTIALGTGITAAWSTKGIWNLFGYPYLGTSANAPIVDASAYMQYIINRTRRFNFDPTNQYLSNAATSTNIFNMPNLVAGANPVAAYLDQYVELDPNSFIGLLNLQEVGQSKVQLTMKNWGSAGGNAGGASSAVTFSAANASNSATFAGTMQVDQLSYDVPLLAQGETLPPLNTIHRFRTKNVVISATGSDIAVALDAGPVYTRIYMRVQVNGNDDTNDVNYVAYRYGLGKEQLRRSLAHQLAYQRDVFGQDLPTGILVFDFGPNDVIRSSSVAAPELVVNLNANTVLGNNNNKLEVVTEEIIQLS